MADKSAASLNPNAAIFVPRAQAATFVPGAAFHQAQTPPSTQQESSPPIPSSTTPVSETAGAIQNGATAQNIVSQSTEKVHEMSQINAQQSASSTSDNNTIVATTTEETKSEEKMSLDGAEEWEEIDEGDGDASGEGGGEDGTSIRKKHKPRSSAPKIKKDYINVVFIGHVDAGKSTIGGHLMYLTGQVDKRTLDKYEKEAREMNRESWYLSWALDTNMEEREKGKTVQVGRAAFETDRKHFTILDAPGHKSFVPNMIGGASQADVAVLVISARKGEFEAGLERGGQTREHATLVKTAGVKHMIVLINKMDDPTVNWDKARYDEAKEKLQPVLKKVGFTEGKDLFFMPCSGQTGAFLKEVAPEDVCRWYRGPSFIEYLDNLPPISRAREGPVRVILLDKYNDMGTVVMGKVESGVVTKGQTLLLMPNRTTVQALQLWSDDDETEEIGPGENVKIKLKGVDEDGVMPGFVICSMDNTCKVVILEHKSIICPGYSAVLHIHEAVEEVTVKALLCLFDRKGEKTKFPRFVKQDQRCIMRLESLELFCLEPFKEFPQMGRFVLRDENRTIAMGKVLKVLNVVE